MRSIDGNLRRGRGPTVCYSAEDFATMSAATAAAVAGGASASNVLGLLWKRGFVGQALIGAFDGAGVPRGPVNLANVSATPVGVIASGTGTTRTVDASPLTLGTSGTVTVWDISAGSAIATGVAYTRSGTTVTFTGGDPGATAAGDLLLDTGACELRLGTDWIPVNGTFYFDGSVGLVGNPGAAHAYCSLDGLHPFGFGSTPKRLVTCGLLTTGTVTAGASSYAGFGYYSTGSGDEITCPAIFNDAGTWKRALQYGASLGSAPSNLSNGATGDPSDLTDIEACFFSMPSDTGDVNYSSETHHPSFTDGAGFGGTVSLATTFGQGANGDPDRAAFICYASSGVLPVTLGSFEVSGR